VCKKLIKNSEPFGKKFKKTVGGIFFDSHCIYGRLSGCVCTDVLTVCTDVVTVLAGGSYVRCFNVVSGSLLWETSVTSAVSSHRASLQLIDTGESQQSLL